MTNSFKDRFGMALFSGRWILTFLYFGLQIAMVLYAYKYSVMIFHLVEEVSSLAEEEFLLAVLGLVDIVMVANLIEMIKSGSYTIFVRRLKIENPDDRPQWLDHMSTGLQKVKMSASILGISSIHLLKDFLNLASPAEEVTKHITIHIVILLSTVGLALTERINSNKNHAQATH